MPKCDFNKVAKHGCSPVNLLHIFRTTFLRNTSGWLLLDLLNERPRNNFFNGRMGYQIYKMSCKTTYQLNETKACKIELKYLPLALSIFLASFISDLRGEHKIFSLPIKGTLMQIWKSANIFVCIWK